MGIYPLALYQNLLLDLHQKNGIDPRVTTQESLHPDATPREAAAFSISKSLLKKYSVENSESQDKAALSKFLTINLACKEWAPRYTDSWDEVLVGELRSTIYDFFHRQGTPLFDNLDEFFHYGRTGPGSSIGSRSNNFYSKMFASPLTCTSLCLYRAYKSYIKNFPEWFNAENIRREHYGEAHVVAGNRLSFVPKDDKISRSICTEPSLNMFVQLGAGHVIERRLLECYGISMADQPFKNRELARKGSLGLGFVTCDLSSASDSLSLPMLDHVLPKYVLNMLKLMRSRVTEVDGATHELNMVSTMGNGFTFPLQTMLFSAVVVSAARARGLKLLYPRGREFGTWGVFGDDIICPDSIWPDVLRLLTFLGFQVNNNKTFSEGPFRESCGSDFFKGRNVRGVYVKRLHSKQDLFAVINQLNLFSARTGLSLPRTVQYLASFTDRTYVPRWDNFDSGIQIPLSIVQKSLKLDKPTQSLLYRRYEPIGSKIRILEGKILNPDRRKPLIYNPSGLFISFLQRSINSYSIGVRHDTVRYKRKLGIAPFWDALPSVHPLSGWFPWQRWNTAVYLNLFG
jgi:hypothetical protein